jgi:hypothetical protein
VAETVGLLEVPGHVVELDVTGVVTVDDGEPKEKVRERVYDVVVVVVVVVVGEVVVVVVVVLIDDVVVVVLVLLEEVVELVTDFG